MFFLLRFGYVQQGICRRTPLHHVPRMNIILRCSSVSLPALRINLRPYRHCCDGPDVKEKVAVTRLIDARRVVLPSD